MSLRSRPLRFAPSEDDGIYIVLVMISIFAFFAVIGVATDSSKIFIESVRQQRASDAAAVSAAAMIGQSPLGPVLTDAQVRNIGLKVAQDNFERNSISYDTATPTNNIVVTVTSDPVTLIKNVSVTTHAPFNTFITGRIIARGSKSSIVNGHAAAVRVPIEMTLIIDVTGSMQNNADPACVTACISKLQAAKNAAKTFVDRFNQSVDGFALVSFSTSATVQYHLAKGFNPTVLKAAIDSLVTGGNTSIHIGLHTGTAEAMTHPNPAAKQILVLMTDGAPNNPSTYIPSLPGACNMTGYNDQKKSQLYAVVESDLARANNIAVYTIGVGPNDPDLSTAFQNVADDGSGISLLKNFLLRRIANAAATGITDPAYPLTCLPAYAQIADKRAGEALASPNGNDLTNMLTRVAKSIQMMLVE